MIDFIKYELNNVNPDILEGSRYLDFHSKVNTKTGELGTFINAYYRGLEFKIFEPTLANPNRRITVEGSLHKYWNNGAHNFNDFGITEIRTTLQDIESKFYIKPENCVLKALEIGVNINPPVRTKTILKHCLLHKTSRLKWIYTADEGNYIQAKHQRHILKIYDKKTHYQKRGFNIPDEVLRIEMKYTKMYDLNKKGIYSLKDLVTYGLNNFTPDLINHWKKVIFYDYKILDKTKYKHTYSNPNFWEDLSKSNRQYHKNNLRNLTSKEPQSIHSEIINRIEGKARILNNETNQINPLYIRLKSIVSNSEKEGENRRFCRVTGLNISMQKEESILLSHTGLKYYYKTDRKVFNEVKRKFLSKTWEKADQKKQIKEIAHNIRNKANNQRNKQTNLYPSYQKKLFDIAT